MFDGVVLLVDFVYAGQSNRGAFGIPRCIPIRVDAKKYLVARNHGGLVVEDRLHPPGWRDRTRMAARVGVVVRHQNYLICVVTDPFFQLVVSDGRVALASLIR